MRYVALLRGINVGGNSKVEMSRLKTVFEKLGFENVKTFINSGNVLFDANEPDGEKIEKAIEKEFGFLVPTVVVSKEKLENVNAKVPAEWVNDAEQKTDVIFLWDELADKKVLNVIKQHPGIDDLLYIDGVIVWHIDKAHYAKSKMRDFISNPIYKKMTARNINTVRKLTRL